MIQPFLLEASHHITAPQSHTLTSVGQDRINKHLNNCVSGKFAPPSPLSCWSAFTFVMPLSAPSVRLYMEYAAQYCMWQYAQSWFATVDNKKKPGCTAYLR